MPAAKPTQKRAPKPASPRGLRKYAEHPRCRPPRDAGADVRMLNDQGRWIRDTGTPGLAFLAATAADPGDAVLWIATCRCPSFRTCPLPRGMARATTEGFDMTSVVRRRAARPQ